MPPLSQQKIRHWQESRSREILEEKWLRFFSLAREKLIFMSRSTLDFQESEEKFLFLLSIFKTWKKFLFLLSIFKIFETNFSFSSRFSRCWRKFLCLLSIFEIFFLNI